MALRYACQRFQKFASQVREFMSAVHHTATLAAAWFPGVHEQLAQTQRKSHIVLLERSKKCRRWRNLQVVPRQAIHEVRYRKQLTGCVSGSNSQAADRKSVV